MRNIFPSFFAQIKTNAQETPREVSATQSRLESATLPVSSGENSLMLTATSPPIEQGDLSFKGKLPLSFVSKLSVSGFHSKGKFRAAHSRKNGDYNINNSSK